MVAEFCQIVSEVSAVSAIVGIFGIAGLKDNIQRNRCWQGLPFLGYWLFPGPIRLVPDIRVC